MTPGVRRIREIPDFLLAACTRPGNRVGDFVLGHPEVGQLGAHRVRAVDAHGSQYDTAVVLRHVEVLRPAARRQNGPWAASTGSWM